MQLSGPVCVLCNSWPPVCALLIPTCCVQSGQVGDLAPVWREVEQMFLCLELSPKKPCDPAQGRPVSVFIRGHWSYTQEGTLEHTQVTLSHHFWLFISPQSMFSLLNWSLKAPHVRGEGHTRSKRGKMCVIVMKIASQFNLILDFRVTQTYSWQVLWDSPS